MQFVFSFSFVDGFNVIIVYFLAVYDILNWVWLVWSWVFFVIKRKRNLSLGSLLIWFLGFSLVEFWISGLGLGFGYLLSFFFLFFGFWLGANVGFGFGFRVWFLWFYCFFWFRSTWIYWSSCGLFKLFHVVSLIEVIVVRVIQGCYCLVHSICCNLP